MFYGGDVYSGEIHERLSYGEGSLKYINSQITYKGKFSKNRFREGVINLPSLCQMSGKFFKGKFKKGIITFDNGDVFRGVW